jgi:hypothetical protein
VILHEGKENARTKRVTSYLAGFVPAGSLSLLPAGARRVKHDADPNTLDAVRDRLESRIHSTLHRAREAHGRYLIQARGVGPRIFSRLQDTALNVNTQADGTRRTKVVVRQVALER